jgi:hypothetical protein
MSEDKNKLTYGSFVRPTVRGPVVDVDCSPWMAQFGEEFVMGNFVTRTTTGPVTHPDNRPEGRSGFVQLDTPKLHLTFSIDPDLGLTPQAVMAKVVPILELVKGCGFTWDRANSNGEPGRIAIQLVPATAEAAARLSWLKEKLTPVLAGIREVKSPVVSEVPASKV